MLLDWGRVKWEGRCKLCCLFKTHRELFEEIHHLVLHVGFSQSRALQVANSKIGLLNLQSGERGESGLAFFNGMNFSNHFRFHLPIDVATALKIRTQALNIVRPENEESESALQKQMDDALRTNLSDYERLTDLVNRFEKRVCELEADLDKKGMSWTRASDFTAMMREVVRMRSELIKLKQSERLISTIVSQVLHTYTVGSLKEILRTVEQIQSELLSSGDTDLAIRVSKRLRESIVEGMESNARIAVEAVSREFGLRL